MISRSSVLVTGATGFIGRHFVNLMLKHGHHVLAVVRDAEAPGLPDGVELVAQDLTARRFELPFAESLIHLAQANVPFPEARDELYAVNTTAVLRLLEHGLRSGASRFLLASSANVYQPSPEPFSEDDALAPGPSFYALTKVHAEQILTAYSPSFETTAVARLFTPYGPGQRARLIPDLIKRVRAGRPVDLNWGASPRLTPVYVQDVVEGLRLMLEQRGHIALNLAGLEVVNIRELAILIGEIVGREPIFEQQDAKIPDLVGDPTRSLKALGAWATTTLDQGLRLTLTQSHRE